MSELVELTEIKIKIERAKQIREEFLKRIECEKVWVEPELLAYIKKVSSITKWMDMNWAGPYEIINIFRQDMMEYKI